MALKVGIAKPIIIFIGSLLLFVLLSRVIYHYNLPAVAVETASPDTIRHSHRAVGSVQVSDYDDIIAHETGIITLYISEGDSVQLGQLLYSIEVDIENLENRLIILEHNRNSQTVQIARINSDITHRQNLGVRAPGHSSLNLFDIDTEIENIRGRIRVAETELNRLRTLFDIGAIPRANLDSMERELDTLNDLLNAAIGRRQNAVDRDEDERARELETYERALMDNARILADLEYQLRVSQLTLEATNDEINRINEQLLTDGVYWHYSTTAGEIMRVFEAARGGRHVMQNTALMSLMPNSAELYAVFSLPNDIDFVEIGDRATLQIRNRRNITGTVETIRFHPSHMEVNVSFESAEVQIGERAETVFEQTSGTYQRTLPNSALREMWWHEGNYFVLIIEQHRGLFGNIYSVQIQGVTVLEEGPSRTAIQNSFPNDVEVVIGSSQTLGPGARVRIVPSSNFFSN